MAGADRTVEPASPLPQQPHDAQSKLWPIPQEKAFTGDIHWHTAQVCLDSVRQNNSRPTAHALMLVGYPSSFCSPELGACKGYPALLPHCRQMDREGTAPVAPLGMAPPRTQPQAWQHGAMEVGWAGIRLPVLRHLLQHCRNLLQAPLPGSPDQADTPMGTARDSNPTTCRLPWRKQRPCSPPSTCFSFPSHGNPRSNQPR